MSSSRRCSRLLNDDVWRRQKHGHRRDDGEHGEDDEAEAVHDHGGELPVADELGLLVRLTHASRDELQLPQDGLQLPLRGWAGPRVLQSGRCGRWTSTQESCRAVGRARAVPEVVVDVQNVRQQAFGRTFFQLQLLHAIAHQDGLAGDLLPRPAHTQDPGEPLQENAFDLEARQITESLS